jgi:hypothetical protein
LTRPALDAGRRAEIRPAFGFQCEPNPRGAVQAGVTNFLGSHLLTALLAGILGAAAMEFAMWLTTRVGPARGSMIVALGSLITGSRKNAFLVGALVHLIAGVGFALLYIWGMEAFGFTHLPAVVAVGIGFGLLHGMMVSLMLVWVVSDHHPLEEFKGADLAIGLSHFMGHIAYGAAVGLVVGLLSS